MDGRRLLTILSEAAWGAAGAYVLWRSAKPDADPFELARKAWRDFEERARYAEAVRRTFDSIRRLPETDE